jgi:uncharacterized protein (UPF0332 family)
MSPRSEEFIVEAKERLRIARAALETDSPSAAVSLAYYAMLYAARAALSEENAYAKTHSGTWQLFRETVVTSKRFDAALAKDAEKTHELRLGADYEARRVDAAEAEAVIELATRFVSAIEALYAD